MHMPTLRDAARGIEYRGSLPATAERRGSAPLPPRSLRKRKEAKRIQTRRLAHWKRLFGVHCTPMSHAHLPIGMHSGVSGSKIRSRTDYRSRSPLARNSAHCSINRTRSVVNN